MRSLKSFFIFLTLCLLSFFTAPLFAKGCKSRLISRGYAVQNKKIDLVDTLSLAGSFNVYLTQGDRPSLRIEGNEADLEQVNVEQHDKKLFINIKKKSGFTFINKKIDVFLTTNTLNTLNLNGSVHLMSENEFRIDDLNILAKGSGRAIIGVNAQNLNVDIKGSGNVVLTGYAQHQDICISGSGSYKANKLLSGSANVNVYGSGTAYLDVERELNIKVYGSGNVLYKGNPSIQSQSYGTGKVKAI